MTHLVVHPIVAAATDVRACLKSVADANPTFMTTSDKANALTELVRAEAQLAELRLRILADASDLAAQTAAKDAAGWLAHHTRTRHADARADLRLAHALDRDRPVLAAAMREGDTTLAQAHVIDRALDTLPASIDGDTVTKAEAHLVAQAAEFGPTELARLGRHILHVIAPDIADAAEAARLADLESHAADQTRLTMRRLGDGTTRISGRVPDAVGTRFATYLQAHANPRRHHEDVDTSDKTDTTGTARGSGDPFTRMPYPKRMGQALCQLLEAIDPDRLPLHGGDATTLIVTIPLAHLIAELATADLLGAGLVPGDHSTGAESTGGQITAAQARRLACTADIIPAVLGGDSRPLDLGRTRRLFNPSQRKAMALRDHTCRAEGCDIPATWCEAHHRHPWSQGGRTDLDDGELLCSHHHHRIHDPAHTTERLPDGAIRFHRRR